MDKGRSLVALPLDFVVLDTETTGLDFSFDNIIEVSAIKFQDGKEVDRLTSFVCPPLIHATSADGTSPCRVPWFITELTGITDAMVENAPSPEEIMPHFYEFIGDSIILGHNIPYDITFINKYAGASPLLNDYVNTIRLAHKVFPDLEHHRLSDIAIALGVDQYAAHRSEADCDITAQCYFAMRDKILSQMTEMEYMHLFGPTRHRDISIHFPSCKELLKNLDVEVENPDTPIFGQTIVFTGALERMSRAEAFMLVAKLGGIPSDSLTQKTNLLVVGNTDFVASVKDGKTGKMKKAEAYIAKGCDISVISENSFFAMTEM